MITIYHNNRCSKSRQGLELLENSGKEYHIKKYLEDIPSKNELMKIIDLLGIEPIDLIRRNEAIWKEKYRKKNLSVDEIVNAMIQYPKLIERPIIINGNNAVIGRPVEKILDII
jgi:arsenate reductase